MKVYLDDERTAPEGWVHVKTAREAIDVLESGKVATISLDHDLGDDAAGTGYDVICWIEREAVTNGFIPPFIEIHSANPAGKMKMMLALDTIARYRHRRL